LLNTILGSLSAGAGAANSYESIATVTVGSGGSSSISFTSIPSDYTHLQIRTFSRISGQSYGLLRFNSDSSSVYGTHFLYGDGANAQATANLPASNIFAIYVGSGSNIFGAGIVDILDYTNTNKFTTTRSLTGADENGSGVILLLSGLWRNTAAITSIEILPNASTFAQYSHFALYGIKGA
jgi:hypothetical protein